MRKMKGITPIISIIILLLITIALAATAYTYMSGFMFGQMSVMSIPNKGAFCSGGQVTIIIRNDQLEGNLTDEDITLLQIDGVDIPAGDIADVTIKPGQMTTLVSNSGSYDAGYHEIRIGTGTQILRQQVYCPS